MGSKDKPCQFDCYANALPDEPMFVLLARDPDFERLVRSWAEQRQRAIFCGDRPDTDMALVYEAMECALDGARWRKDNLGSWRKPIAEGGDPTTTELLKPNGNGGMVNVEICELTLLLVGDVNVTREAINTWSADQLAQAYDWAMRVHLHASDNDDVLVPPRPDFIPRRAS